ncbi:MAG: hypothetical protein R2838_01740 [Caldilineaceae bacterium]
MWLARGADTYVPGWFGWTAILFQSVVATYLGRMMTYNAVKIIGSGQFTPARPWKPCSPLSGRCSSGRTARAAAMAGCGCSSSSARCWRLTRCGSR